MDIFKIIAIGLAGGLLCVTLKQYGKEYAVLTALVTAALVMLYSLQYLSSVIDSIRSITETTGVDSRYLTAVMKVVGVAYISQFGAELLRDSGEGAIAAKVEAAGKIFILALTVPIITEFLEVCINALSSV